MDKKIAMIMNNEESPPRIAELSKLARKIAQTVFIQTWDFAINELSSIEKFKETTGDECLSYMSCIAANMLAGFIYHSKLIVDRDDTGYTIEQIQQSIIDCTSKIISIKEPIKRTSILEINEIKTQKIKTLNAIMNDQLKGN